MSDKAQQEQEIILLHTRWPKDDWASRINDERPDGVLKLLDAIYDDIREEPRIEDGGISAEKWQQAYTSSLNILKALFRKTKTQVDVAEINVRFASRLGLDYQLMKETPLEKSYPYWAISKSVLPAISSEALSIPTSESVQDTETAQHANIPVHRSPPTENFFTNNHHSDEKPELEPKPAPVTVSLTGDKTEAIKAEYGLKGIIFAASAGENKRADDGQLVQEAHQALSDLAEALGISKRWIGLSASVNLQIGANPQSSNTECTHTIVYTGHESANPIAHQWGSCFNAYIAQSASKDLSSPVTYASQMEKNALSDVKSALVRAIATRVNEITMVIGVKGSHGSEYLKSTLGYMKWKKLPEGTIDAPQVMFARAFCAYIHDCMIARKKTNLVLTGDTLNLTGVPYPIAAERKRLYTLLDELFSLLKPAAKTA